MFVQFQYITIRWSPPPSSEEEAWAMGERVATLGKAHLRGEFRRQAMRAGRTQPPQEFRPVRCALAVGLLIVVSVFMPMIIPIVLFVLLMYFGSLGIALLRYDRWLAKCLACYQRHQRAGTRPAGKPAIPVPPPDPNAVLFQPYAAITAKYLHLEDLGTAPVALLTVTISTHRHLYEFVPMHGGTAQTNKIYLMTVEVLCSRVQSVMFTKQDGDLDDDDVEELLKANSGGVTWGTDPAHPQFLFRGDDKAVASYGDGRRTLHLQGRDWLVGPNLGRRG